ncbi:hypothetical protein UPYG_G00234200 [Umbra pygmaea]|uniref:Uncharacterized protein n=1 Tax=Umbra pygmaea TaxID=75934 RepID=A0ABD0X4I8_UMBPY
MCFSKEDADLVVEKIDQILTDIEMVLGLQLPPKADTDNGSSKKVSTEENGCRHSSGIQHSCEKCQQNKKLRP